MGRIKSLVGVDDIARIIAEEQSRMQEAMYDLQARTDVPFPLTAL